jgi:hypothetical protein
MPNTVHLPNGCLNRIPNHLETWSSTRHSLISVFALDLYGSSDVKTPLGVSSLLVIKANADIAFGMDKVRVCIPCL